jgi:hypothetical protein
LPQPSKKGVDGRVKPGHDEDGDGSPECQPALKASRKPIKLPVVGTAIQVGACRPGQGYFAKLG